METVNTVIAVVCFGVILWGLWQLYGGPMPQPDIDFQLNRFTNFLAILESPEDDYEFYEQSHLIWAKSNQDSIRKLIRTTARMQPGINTHISHKPRFYHFRVNEKDKRVYFAISDQSQFEWDNLSHYSEYLGSQTSSGT